MTAMNARVTVGWLAWLSVLALPTLACAPRSSAVEVLAPDGRPALHVSCPKNPGACYRLAGDRCRSGYAIQPAHGEASYLVRCREALYYAPAPYPYTGAPAYTAAPVAPPPSAPVYPPPAGRVATPPGTPPLYDPLIKNPWPGEDLGY